MTVQNENSLAHTTRHRLAAATASSSIALGPSYGFSTPIRTAPGVAAESGRPTASSASSMECWAISCWALAVSASASCGYSVDSALASRARIRESIRGSPVSGPAARCSTRWAAPGAARPA